MEDWHPWRVYVTKLKLGGSFTLSLAHGAAIESELAPSQEEEKEGRRHSFQFTWHC